MWWNKKTSSEWYPSGILSMVQIVYCILLLCLAHWSTEGCQAECNIVLSHEYGLVGTDLFPNILVWILEHGFKDSWLQQEIKLIILPEASHKMRNWNYIIYQKQCKFGILLDGNSQNILSNWKNSILACIISHPETVEIWRIWNLKKWHVNFEVELNGSMETL